MKKIPVFNCFHEHQGYWYGVKPHKLRGLFSWFLVVCNKDGTWQEHERHFLLEGTYAELFDGADKIALKLGREEFPDAQYVLLRDMTCKA